MINNVQIHFNVESDQLIEGCFKTKGITSTKNTINTNTI